MTARTGLPIPRPRTPIMNAPTRRRRPGTSYAMWITGGGLLLILVFLGVSWMRPLYYSDAELRQEAHRRFSQQIDDYGEAVRQRRTAQPLRLPMNQFVELEVAMVPLARVQPGTGDTAAPGDNYVMRARLRLEVVVTLLMMVAFIVVLLRNLYEWMGWAPSPPEAATATTSAAAPFPDAAADPQPRPAAPTVAQTAEQVFIEDVARLQARADELIVWSGLYLLGGLMISAVGIFAFFLFTPQPNPSAGTPAVLLAALRPTAMLLFFEGLAFFLLRQHKALLREHGRLIALILKRNNWVAACRLLAAGALVNPASAGIVAALSAELIANTTDEPAGAAGDGPAHDVPVLAALIGGAAGQGGAAKGNG